MNTLWLCSCQVFCTVYPILHILSEVIIDIDKLNCLIDNLAITRWMHDIIEKAWVSTCAERRPVTWIWLLSECDWASGHRISQHRNCESGLGKACCTQAGAAHAADHVEMEWTDESHPFLACTTGSPNCCSQPRSESSDRFGTVSQATMTNSIDRLPCSYLYCSSHWIGESTSSLHPCHHWGVRLFACGSGFDCYPWRKENGNENENWRNGNGKLKWQLLHSSV